ncbi:MAG: abhydrolase domain-containing 18 [Opitutus sp.]|nr:abhydrolase domain-containing 18 [Opitutus sp.]
MNLRYHVAACLALVLNAGCLCGAADSRAAFLRLLDRPRVELAGEAAMPVAKDGLSETAFSFATEAGQRVPGILVKSTTSSGRRPVVVALHGTGGNKESQRKLLGELARAGFVGVAIDGRYHGARTKGGKEVRAAEYVEAILRTFRTGREHPFFFDTAWDVMRLIDFLETRDDVDPRRIGLIGFSKGGIETYLAAAADPRIAVAVPCIGVQSFRWALENNSWQSRIGTVQKAFDTAAKENGVTQPGAAFVRTFYDRVAPGIYGEFDGPAMLPLIAPRPLLSINGEIDPRTPGPGLQECADAARAAYRAAGAGEKFVLLVQPNTAHKVLPESLVLAREWFIRWLKP